MGECGKVYGDNKNMGRNDMRIDFFDDTGVVIAHALIDEMGHWDACGLGHDLAKRYFPNADDFDVIMPDDKRIRCVHKKVPIMDMRT